MFLPKKRLPYQRSKEAGASDRRLLIKPQERLLNFAFGLPRQLLKLTTALGAFIRSCVHTPLTFIGTRRGALQQQADAMRRGTAHFASGSVVIYHFDHCDGEALHIRSTFSRLFTFVESAC